MPKLFCTEPVCRHEWSQVEDPTQPRCPRCGGFWVRVVADADTEADVSRDRASRHSARPRPRPLGRRYANAR
jgi:hypothetical protein